jgi:predicted deacylase
MRNDPACRRAAQPRGRYGAAAIMAGMTQDGMIDSTPERIPADTGARRANTPRSADHAGRVHDARRPGHAPARTLQAAP